MIGLRERRLRDRWPARLGLHRRLLLTRESPAQLNDDITFNVAGASATTVTNIGLDFTLDGTVGALQNISYLYELKMVAGGREGRGVS